MSLAWIARTLTRKREARPRELSLRIGGMDGLGFRQPTSANWREPDPTMSLFVTLDDDGNVTPISGERLVEDLQSPALSTAAPEEVRRLFETARGAMCYGYFFYPLFTLAAQQLFRVVEAAVSAKCEELRPGQRTRTFDRGIRFLETQGVVTSDDAARLHLLRRLRNEASHPRKQDIFTPGMALDAVSLTADFVNKLFP